MKFFARFRKPQPKPVADVIPNPIAATLKPCPEIRERRLRQMSPERRARAERNAREIADLIGGAL